MPASDSHVGAARLLTRGLVDRNGELQLTETGADLRTS